jgi:hypothetical protein
MRSKAIKAIVASVAAAAALIGPVIVGKSALAENTDQVVAMDESTYLNQPSETHPGYMLPPLSDHLMVAKLNDAQFALEEDEDEGALEEDDGTAKEYNRGYYAEPVQVVWVVVAPSSLEAIELSKISDDETARQYDRGYYKDPEIIVAVALIVVPSEDIED